MQKEQKPLTDPFDLRDGRAMVSLGQLTRTKYCTFSCPFCYVRADFKSYASLPITAILDWLQLNTGKYDIVYVSGDTDSFSAPRTELGVELLERIAELGVDVLFTTRAVFGGSHLERLAQIAARLTSEGHTLFGCVSVAQLSLAHLEPHPIPPPHIRINQLCKFRAAGLASILAMRPFLPIVPLHDYLEIVRLSAPCVDAILGEVWYADEGGVLERGVFKGPTPASVHFERHVMDFDANSAVWKVYPASEQEAAVRTACETVKVPFYMRSRPAIEAIRARRRSARMG